MPDNPSQTDGSVPYWLKKWTIIYVIWAALYLFLSL